MLNVVFPALCESRSPAFYLAAEEYLARNSGEDFFMLWRVGPSVIFGRNQDMEAEVNLPFCRREGIGVFRRKSGGGCVYADNGNLMISSVTSGNDKPFLFSRFISALALFLRSRGYDAWPSGRNDILVSGRKVSGSAFYSTGDRNIMHATLLCDTDIGIMVRAITPPAEKLRTKGIASVRQRVANLSGFPGSGTGGMEQALTDFFCDGMKILTEADMARIEALEQEYLDEKFIAGRRRARMEDKILHDGTGNGNIEENMSV